MLYKRHRFHDDTHGYPTRGKNDMSDRDAFGRILASLHDAMLDDSRWPAVSALIDEALRHRGQ